MSIAEQQEKIRLYLTNAYDKCNEKKATIPEKRNLQNLASCIESITEGGGGGSSSYNVYYQTSEPTDKNGVWIKENSGSGTPKVYFSLNATSKGDFISSDAYGFLGKTSNPAAMCVVGKYLYVFGSETSNSYIYNLQTRQYIGNINRPSGSPFGAYEYSGKIFVFTGVPSNISYFVYDIETNTSSNSVVYTYRTGDAGYFISGRYGDEVYLYWSGYTNFTEGTKFNLETKSFSGTAMPSYNEVVYKKEYSFTTVGKKIYIYDTYNHRLVTIEMGSSTFTTQANMFENQQGCIYGQGDYLYMFPNGANKTTYYRYHLIDKTLETITTRIPYSSTFSSGKQAMVFEEITGLLYFINGSYSPSVMQFGNSPLVAGLNSGTVVIAQAFDNKVTLIKNSDNLFVCVGDTFIVKGTVDEQVLDGEHVSFYGDGERWHLLKNPTGETAIITFNTAGGNTIESQEVVLGQKLASVETPTKTGYEFEDWYLEDEVFDFNTRIIKDITLVAHWLAYLTVTFNTDGGTLIESQQVLEGQKLASVETPTKSGYVFKCWQLNGEDFDLNTPITEDITLTAVYEEINFIAYIESTGTQYIDTEFKPNNNTSIEMKVLIPTSQTGKYVRFFESRNNASEVKESFGILSFDDSNNLLQFRYNTSANLSNNQLAIDTEYVVKTDKNKMYVNDELKITQTASTFQVNYNLHLFGYKSPSDQHCNTGIYRMYYFKIYDNGTLVRDFKPALDSDGVACLFDTVTNKYFYNAGTGTFTAGTEV